MNESANMPSATPRAGSDDRETRMAAKIAEFRRRNDHLLRSYQVGFAVSQERLSFNESLKAGARSLNPRAKNKPRRMRIHPDLEIKINDRATKLAIERGSEPGRITQRDVNEASREIIALSKPRKGRPADPLLSFHVKAYMALYRQSMGEDLKAGLTRNGEYAPHIKSPVQDAMVKAFQSINPNVTLACLVNIIWSACRSGAVEGKRFMDFFPFYGGGFDPVSGLPVPGPGYRLERLVVLAPIYSS